ncbi:MAG: diguanylate cyclase [Phycisphaerales bacterium]|nr:diguanylate cyclase [Phycisphaerales bacterium]
MIVDDHAVSRLYTDRLVRNEGLYPLQASSAQEALAIAGTRPVDIWLIDWMMPGMSGVELVRSIRAQPDGHLAYILMVTSKGELEDVARAFDAGVDDFLRKPIEPAEFCARFRAAVRIATVNRELSAKITEIEALNANLEAMASTDAMTGLFNRRAGMSRLADRWDLAVRDATDLSVSVIDIDRFKRINDAFGHARGDAAIRFVGSVISESLRDMDFVARIGGEEFLVVLPGTSLESAARIIDRCRDAVSKGRCRAEGRVLEMSISAGVACRDPSIESYEQLVHLADAALYTSKHEGRNKVSCAENRRAA